MQTVLPGSVRHYILYVWMLFGGCVGARGRGVYTLCSIRVTYPCAYYRDTHMVEQAAYAVCTCWVRAGDGVTLYIGASGACLLELFFISFCHNYSCKYSTKAFVRKRSIRPVCIA